jgi:hypothetical protein
MRSPDRIRPRAVLASSLMVTMLAAASLPGTLSALATGGPTPGSYDFEHLTAGISIDGQDGWRVTSNNGGATTVRIPDGSSRNEFVPGHDGSKAARQINGGASVSSLAVRRDDATWSITPVSATGITVIEWEMNRPYWGAGFALGTSADGVSMATGFEVISRNSAAPRHRIRGPGDAELAGHSDTIAVFGRYQVIIDGSDGSVSVVIRDLAPGSTAGWVAPAALQGVSAGLDGGATAANPANWNAMRLRSDSFDPSSLFDNIAFRTVEPSTRSIDVGATPLTTSSSGSVTINGLHLTGRLTATVAGAGFTLDDGTTSRAGVANGTITVRYSPTALGAESGTLTLVGDDMARPLVVALAGTGTPAPPPPAPPPTATVHCDGVVPAVGVELTCTVEAAGAAGADIVWRASYNPVFADGVVRIGPDGTGELRFAIPAAAAGAEITVELVAWTEPIPVGWVAGPVPTRIPAGEGRGVTAAWTLVVPIAAIAAAAFLVTGRRPSRSRR